MIMPMKLAVLIPVFALFAGCATTQTETDEQRAQRLGRERTEQFMEKLRTDREQDEKSRRAKFFAAHPDAPEEIKGAVNAGRLVIGMTSDAALASWGEPRRINRTTTASGRFEQWVYGTRLFLYFTDGKLTGWQD